MLAVAKTAGKRTKKLEATAHFHLLFVKLQQSEVSLIRCQLDACDEMIISGGSVARMHNIAHARNDDNVRM